MNTTHIRVPVELKTEIDRIRRKRHYSSGPEFWEKDGLRIIRKADMLTDMLFGNVKKKK